MEPIKRIQQDNPVSSSDIPAGQRDMRTPIRKRDKRFKNEEDQDSKLPHPHQGRKDQSDKGQHLDYDA